MPRPTVASVQTRLRAMLNRTVANGCTEAEAMTALRMAARLRQHPLLRGVGHDACVRDWEPLGGARRLPIDRCVSMIARFCDCKVWVQVLHSGQRAYMFFGFAADVPLARALYRLVARALQSEADHFKARDVRRGHSLRRAILCFQRGMVQRIRDRLYGLLCERERASVERPRYASVEHAFAGLTMPLRKHPRRLSPCGDQRAYRAGQRAANQLRLAPAAWRLAAA